MLELDARGVAVRIVPTTCESCSAVNFRIYLTLALGAGDRYRATRPWASPAAPSALGRPQRRLRRVVSQSDPSAHLPRRDPVDRVFSAEHRAQLEQVLGHLLGNSIDPLLQTDYRHGQVLHPGRGRGPCESEKNDTHVARSPIPRVRSRSLQETHDAFVVAVESLLSGVLAAPAGGLPRAGDHGPSLTAGPDRCTGALLRERRSVPAYSAAEAAPPARRRSRCAGAQA